MSDAPPPDERPFPDIYAVDERTILEGMLEWYREAVVAKVDGLTDEQAKRHLVGSLTTILGLLKHLAGVEDSWFHDRYAGQPDPPVWANVSFDDEPDWDFTSIESDTLAENVSLYHDACARSRAAAAGQALDGLARNGGRRTFNLRWAYVHLIEETARHLGHMDILRELTDGATGE
jgi:uncharacterized damage-inducible protein DinB